MKTSSNGAWLTLAAVICIGFPVASVQAAPLLPTVSSANLVAHFRADDASVAIDALGNVGAWAARNEASITAVSTGDDITKITYNPTGMNGSPTLIFDDPDSTPHENQFLWATLPAGVSLTNATIFWLGFYSPTAATYGR